MDNIIYQFFLWGSEAILAGLIITVGRLWLSHMNFREHVAREYARKYELDALVAKSSNDLAVVKETVEKILGMVHEIKGSLHGITRE